MLRALYTASTGAQTQQFNIDVIANNISNVNTTGFKKTRVEFQDLLSQTYETAGTLTEQGTTDPVGVQVGLGTVVSATQKVFLPGSIVQTGNPLDVALTGDAYFVLEDEDAFVCARPRRKGRPLVVLAGRSRPGEPRRVASVGCRSTPRGRRP